MVPTARLELAQLSPLPPQDSVSTNFTTWAFRVPSEARPPERPAALLFRYLGTSPAFDAGSAAGADLAGSAPPDGTGAPAAGGVVAGVDGISAAFDGGNRSITPCCTLLRGAARVDAYQVRPRLDKKNAAARTAVVRDRKLAEPDEPKTLPDEPLPKAAPMSAPFPCCNSTNPQMPMATITCATSRNVSRMLI